MFTWGDAAPPTIQCLLVDHFGTRTARRGIPLATFILWAFGSLAKAAASSSELQLPAETPSKPARYLEQVIPLVRQPFRHGNARRMTLTLKPNF
jgi:hypothetical protein